MRYIMLLLIPSLGFAMSVADAITAHDKAVAVADVTLLKVLVSAVRTAKDIDKPDLYKLILKYDPMNATALAFVNAAGVGDKTDLLGGTITQITQANAMIIAKGYQSDKIRGNDWESFPGQEVVVSYRGLTKTGLTVNVGEVYLIAPHPTDKWQDHPQDEPVTWKGLGTAARQMSLMYKVVVDRLAVQSAHLVTDGVIIKITAGGNLVLHACEGDDGGGTMRVKILKVIP